MALLTIRDESLGTITWEPPRGSTAERVLEDHEGRELVSTELKRFLLLLDGTLKSGPYAPQHLQELTELMCALARSHAARLKKADQN